MGMVGRGRVTKGCEKGLSCGVVIRQREREGIFS